ncbi:alkaline phosphatase D family protein [Planctomycetaceae bacterium SH139]
MILKIQRLAATCCLILFVSAANWSGIGLATCSADSPAQATGPVQRIAFGSCANQFKPCPIWGTIADYDPDLLLLLGDNIYADLVDGKLKPATPERITESYQQLALLPDFARLRRDVSIMATWDDHDYGNNDAGVEWEHKDVAAELFHDFFATPADSPRRSQRGIYHSQTIGPVGQRVQIIMLDTRYFRSELAKADTPLPGFRARPYITADGTDATMLGEAQWKWLEQQLRQPAELRIIGSSIQVLSNDHPFEKWGNMPREQARLYELIRETQASGVVIISGDRHLGEISVDPASVGYPLYDITASGLNQATQGWREVEANRLRVAALPYGNHFGSIEIDWTATDPLVALQLRHEDGEVAIQSRVPLSKLQAQPLPTPLPSGVLDPAAANAAAVGAAVAVQLLVKSGRELGERDRLLLNSEPNFRNPRNFTIVVNRSAFTGPLANANLETFLNHSIRVRGVISVHNSAKQLVVEDVEQIDILD